MAPLCLSAKAAVPAAASSADAAIPAMATVQDEAVLVDTLRAATTVQLHAVEDEPVQKDAFGLAGRLTFKERWAIKTNAFEWVLTIPNIGVEFDLKGSEYSHSTLGLTAKYNWNTYHKYTPPTLFNLFDVRPEYRYYYRDVKRTAGKGRPLGRAIREKKDPKPWRANFVGVYASYGTYAFKFGQKGHQGYAYGFGATAGYAIPMYEYRTGAIDIELGFSVGLQMATREVFIHNPNVYSYVQVLDESKDLHFTPFPVVSEIKVAFAWRHKSIKDKVKEDDEKQKVKSYYDEKIVDQFVYPFREETTKERYDLDLRNMERTHVMKNDSLYRAGFEAFLDATEQNQLGFIPNAFPDEMKNSERADIRLYVETLQESLVELVTAEKKKALKKFLSDWSKAKSAAKKESAKKKDEKQ